MMFGIDMPRPFVQASECGNCQSLRTVKYYPSCCILTDRARLQPLFEQMIACVEALEQAERLISALQFVYGDCFSEQVRNDIPNRRMINEKALAALAALVEEK